MVERRGGVSVFAHQRGWGERPSRRGSGVVADRWWWGWWWGCRPAQRPYCCPPTPPQHRAAEPGIISLNEDEGQVGRGWAGPEGGMGACRSPHNCFSELDANLQEGDYLKTVQKLPGVSLICASQEHTSVVRQEKSTAPCVHPAAVQVWPDQLYSLTSTQHS